MPVIQEKRQFLTQTIGVARASRAGEITGEAISRSASALNDIAFEFAAKNAEDRGEEQARSVEASHVTGIDPETGAPKALNNLKGMGRIQADAYERIIDRRFQDSMEDEMRFKSQDLALQTPDPEKYDALMSEYMANMANGAKGTPYSTFIADTGAVYLNQTKLVLKDAAIARAKAAAKKAASQRLKYNKLLAYNMGATEAETSGSAGTGESLKGLVEDQANVIGDVQEFTSESIPTEIQGASQAVIDQYAIGFATSSLPSMTREDRNNLLINLNFGADYRMGPEATAVFSRIKTLSGGARTDMAKIGNAIAPEIGLINRTFTSAEIDAQAVKDKAAADALVTDALKEQEAIAAKNLADAEDDNSDAFNVTNLNLDKAVKDNDFFHNPSQAIDQLNLLRVGDNDSTVESGVSPDSIQKRQTLIDRAEDQIYNGLLLQAVSKIQGLDEDKLRSIKNGLKNKNLSVLFSMVPDLDASESASLKSFVLIADPAVAITSLESMQDWEVYSEGQKVRADNLALNSEKDSMIAGTLDGTFTQDDLNQLVSGAPNADPGVVSEIQDSFKDYSAAGDLREILIPTNGQTILDKDTLKEVKLLAGGTNIPTSSTPTLNSLKLRGPVQKALNAIKDVDLRKNVISALLDTVPSDKSASMREETFQSFVQAADSTNLSDPSVTSATIDANREAYFKKVDADPILKATQKAELKKRYNDRAVGTLLTRALSDVNPDDLNLVESHIQNPSAPTDLPQSVQDSLNEILPDVTDGEARSSLASQAGQLISNLSQAYKQQEANDERDLAVKAVNNGYPIDDTPASREYSNDALLARHNLEAAPLDIFQNASEYHAAASNPDDPKHKGGLYLQDFFTAARDSGLYTPEFKKYLIVGASGGSLGNKPVNQEFLADVIANLGFGKVVAQAGVTRSSLFNDMGLSGDVQGVLEGLGNARIGGIDPAYIDKVAMGLNNPSASSDAFNQFLGKQTQEDFIEKSLPWKMSANIMSNPDMMGLLKDYSVGLFLSGMDKSDISKRIEVYVKGELDSDKFTVGQFGKVGALSQLTISRSFPSNEAKAAAIGLFQIQMYEEMGRQKMPNASRRKQIEQGKILFSSKYGKSTIGRGFSIFQPTGADRIVFAPIYGGTNRKATFVPYVVNSFDETMQLSTDLKIRTSDNMVMKMAQALKIANDGSGLDLLNSTSVSQVFENSMIDVYLGGRRP